jgi:lysophospholipase L1-like esterase
LPKKSTRFQVFSPLLILTLAFLLFETALRRWWPQTPVLEGPAVSLQDVRMGRPYPSNGHLRYRLPQRTVDLQFNAEGMRDAASHPIPKPAGIFRILLVGDSFTAGMANQYDEIWPVLLERRLAAKGRSVDVIKAGVDSYDTLSELLTMKRLVPKYRPDLILMAFLPNDIFDNTLPEPAPHAAVAIVTELGIAFPQLQSVYFFRRMLLRNDFIYTGVYWMTSRRQYFTEKQTSHAAEQYSITRELLSQASGYASSEGSRFAVASIPQCFQVLAKARDIRLPGLSADIVDRRLSRLAGQRGFPWLSSLDVLAAHYRGNREDLYYREDGHFTPLGNRVFGEWLTGELLRLYGPDLEEKT